MLPCVLAPAYVGDGIVVPSATTAFPMAQRSAYACSMSSGDITFAGIGCIGMKVDMAEADAVLPGL